MDGYTVLESSVGSVTLKADLANLMAFLTQHNPPHGRSDYRHCHPTSTDLHQPQDPRSCQEVPGALQLGKQLGRTLVATGINSLLSSPLLLIHTKFFYRYKFWSQRYPTYLCWPKAFHQPMHTQHCQHSHLWKMLTHPQRTLVLQSLQWIFVIADIKKPVLGVMHQCKY